MSHDWIKYYNKLYEKTGDKVTFSVFSKHNFKEIYLHWKMITQNDQMPLNFVKLWLKICFDFLLLISSADSTD